MSLLEMRDIRKSFSGVSVLKGVKLTVEKGEVHALLGENGAGKSTLMNILTGVLPKDGGTIEFDGQKLEHITITQSEKMGIAFVHQELNLFNDLKVFENMFLNREYTNKIGRLDKKRMKAEARELFERLGVEIDLSVGSMLALTSGLSVIVFNMTGSILLTLLFALAFGALCGFVNGVLVGGVQMPAFIVTLATMLIYRSFAQYFCQHVDRALIGGGSSVYKMDTAKASYQALFGFGNGKLATIPNVGIVMLVMTALFVYISDQTKYGKKIYAIGSNAKAAKMSGISVSKMKISAFTICGILTGLGAFLWIAMNGSADPATTGSSYEMYAIASVVLGGIAMSGGRGKMLGVLFGAMSYTIVDKIIVALKMDSLINNAIKGIILILVIFVQVAGPQIRDKFRKAD